MRIELFDEIYGFYYSAIYHILNKFPSDGLEYKSFCKLVKRISDEYVFPERKNKEPILKTALLNGVEYHKNIDQLELLLDDNEVDEIKMEISWPFFIKDDMGLSMKQLAVSNGILKSRLNNLNYFPLSTIEKRWLRSIYSDPRVMLFLEDNDIPEGLKDVEPLFDWNDFVLFDKYSDGDPFQDDIYKSMFRAVLNSVHNQNRLKIRFRIQNNNLGDFDDCLNQEVFIIKTKIVDPDYLEYSERDDKFKLIGTDIRLKKRCTINIASIISCEETDIVEESAYNLSASNESQKREAEFVISNDNNTLERFLLAFSHYEKIMDESTDDIDYRIRILYDEADETDVVIRVLSFGPSVRVVKSDTLIDLIRDRLKKQIYLDKDSSYY